MQTARLVQIHFCILGLLYRWHCIPLELECNPLWVCSTASNLCRWSKFLQRQMVMNTRQKRCELCFATGKNNQVRLTYLDLLRPQVQEEEESGVLDLCKSCTKVTGACCSVCRDASRCFEMLQVRKRIWNVSIELRPRFWKWSQTIRIHFQLIIDLKRRGKSSSRWSL